ncbi:MAG: hypothetical protein FJ197_06895 [Gammaproteobacteria bacterium]|nr:hypothetical protein [Gammaproteobacteria bacterium]
MTGAQSAIASIMGERGRLRTAHEMLNAALQAQGRAPSFVPFYIAVADFMQAAMGRLDRQDVKMLDRLAEKLGKPTPEEREIIAEVHRRLDGNRAHLRKFLAAGARLQTDQADPAAIEEFESTSAAYIDYIHNRMGHHAPSTDMARRLFSEADWVEMAAIDPEYFAREKQLYSRLLESRPECVPLGLAAEEYVRLYRSDKGLD